MKCRLSLFLSQLFLLISNVSSLGLTIQPTPLPNGRSLVDWSFELGDPLNETFDLRFVQNQFTDVGLASANILLDRANGQVSVAFPGPGTFTVVAVSGSPRNTQIGVSNAVVVEAPPPPSAPTDQVPITITHTHTVTMTVSASSSPTASRSPSQSSDGAVPGVIAGPRRDVNLPAIVGGVIGGLVMLGVLAALFVWLNRRRQITRRFTFHQDMMVQKRDSHSQASLPVPITSPAARITPYPFSASLASPRPPPVQTMPADVEHGLPSGGPVTPFVARSLGSALASGPLGTGHIVPSPRGPRPSMKRPNKESPADDSIVPDLPPMTERQEEVANRIGQLRLQISDIKRASQPGSAHAAALGDMQRQMVWLTDLQESPWALGRTDAVPPGWSRYMTP